MEKTPIILDRDMVEAVIACLVFLHAEKHDNSVDVVAFYADLIENKKVFLGTAAVRKLIVSDDPDFNNLVKRITTIISNKLLKEYEEDGGDTLIK